MKLFYVPLECYPERYTMQWSAPYIGWLEKPWRDIVMRHSGEFIRVEGTAVQQTITKGTAVDAIGRSKFCFSQISKLLTYLEEGVLTDQDVIFFDDFWTPGLESLRYAFDIYQVHPKMYAFCHAQSVDEYDFTHKMKSWMRPMEKAYSTMYDGIFVNCTFLKDLLVEKHVAKSGGPKNRKQVAPVHVTGHVFSSEGVMNVMPEWYRKGMERNDVYLDFNKQNHVLFTSRFDQEKNPDFFLKVAEAYLDKYGDNTYFIICTSQRKLRSNNNDLLVLLDKVRNRRINNVILKENLTKKEYYLELALAKVQFNCASQDFISIALLEAVVAGCYPIYPKVRSFPEAFYNEEQYMYPMFSIDDAVEKIRKIILSPKHLWSPDQIKSRSWIYKKHDTSWARMAKVMGLPVPEVLPDNTRYDFQVWDKKDYLRVTTRKE